VLEGAQHQRGDEEHRPGGHDELVDPEPDLLADGPQGRYPVRRDVHEDPEALALDDCREALPHQGRDRQVEDIESERPQGAEGCGDKRQDHHGPGRAGDERYEERGDDAIGARLEGARRHQRRHVAAVSEDQGDEALPVEPQALERSVHEERGARQVANVLEE